MWIYIKITPSTCKKVEKAFFEMGIPYKDGTFESMSKILLDWNIKYIVFDVKHKLISISGKILAKDRPCSIEITPTKFLKFIKLW